VPRTPSCGEHVASPRKLGATVLGPSPAAYEKRVRADRRAWDPVLKTLAWRRWALDAALRPA